MTFLGSSPADAASFGLAAAAAIIKVASLRPRDTAGHTTATPGSEPAGEATREAPVPNEDRALGTRDEE
ncbi:hypothetical protein [Streptomyces sp. NPDC057694]|uniref:hypothetical protein n=1 Tax=Streptomyces sp. NPDC057694 TaxID=3346216 RepID=UPI0036923755